MTAAKTSGTVKKTRATATQAAPAKSQPKATVKKTAARKATPAATKTAKAKPKVKAVKPPAKTGSTAASAGKSRANPATKAAKTRKSTKKSTENGLSAARKQVMRKSARKKSAPADSAAAIAQERARQALESISVVRHDSDSIDGNGSSARKRRYNQRELSAFRDMLLRVRYQLEQQVQSLRSASLTRDDAVNSEEDGTDAFERQLALNLASTEGDSIFEIDEALQRIGEGTYGVCQECGCLVRPQRLKALPFTTLCIACKNALEKTANGRARRPMV